MLLIGLGVTIVAGSTGIQYWTQRHDLVELQLRRKFNELAPELRLIPGQVQLEDLHRLTLSNVEVRDRTTDQPLLRARRVCVKVDSQMLLEHQRVVIRSVQVDGADVLVTRQDDGHWNWQNYEFRTPSANGGTLPQIDIRNLRTKLRLNYAKDVPPIELLLLSHQIQLVPASAHVLDLEGAVEVRGSGVLNLTGKYDLATGAWSVGGQLQDMTADRKLLELAQITTPLVRNELQRLNQTLQKILPQQQTTTINRDSALLVTHNISSSLKFQGQFNIDFDIRQQPDQQTPDFRLLADIKDGQLSISGLPIHLSDMSAEFFADNNRVTLQIHQARYEDSTLTGQFTRNTLPGSAPPVASFKLLNFHIGPRLKPFLPLAVMQLFDRFQPDLRVTGSGQLSQHPDGKWVLSHLKAKVTEGRLLHHRFRYPLTGIRATLSQRPLQQTNGEVVIDVQHASGLAETQPWKATGWWKNPGPAVESQFVLDVADFPLDGRFREALEPATRRVIESLDLTGLVAARLWFNRPAGIGNKTFLRIDGRISDARLRFVSFPYQIGQLSGRVTFNSQTAQWEFSELHGHHGSTEIFGDGQFVGLPRPGVLDLTLRARRLDLSSDLYNALTESQQSLWQLMDPLGFCDLTAQIHWTSAPGQRAVVHFPAETPVRIYDAKIRPRPFPYEMNIEEATLSFDPNDPRFSGVQYCEIHSFKASHNDAPIVAAGWAKAHSDGHWQVHLNHLTAKQLSPDDDLRAALPDSWREILTRLHRQGRVSVVDSEMDFRGTQDNGTNVTAAWDMNLYLHDCALSAGLDMDNVSGRLTATGTWDGTHLENVGAIQMETTKVLDMPLTRIYGPYSIQDAKLVLGTQEVLESGQLSQLDPNQRLAAQVYGGTLFLDAVVDSRPGSGYLMFAELQDASLQSFAHENLEDAEQLEGKVSAWLALKGEGDAPEDIKGSGQLEISPAALYELPVVLEVLKALTSLNPSNRTAFDYAMLAFDVQNGRFGFKRADLVGESMALRGRGSVGFGGDVVLDFYSRPAGSRPRIGNLVSNLLLNSATQWAKVEVRGTTGRPQARLLPTAQLDDSVRQFLSAMNAAPGNVPRLKVPRVFPFAGSPLTFGPFPFQR